MMSLTLASLAACTTVVVPPAAPTAPVQVFLLDHGRHASLVLPAADGALLRYAYGDWRYYAQSHTGPAAGVAALLWPTRGALGRRRLRGPASLAALRGELRVGLQAFYVLNVSGARLRALRERLERRFRDGEGAPLYNPVYDLWFVRDAQDYDLLHNSNQTVAGWLWALGCRVQGMALYSRWAVRP